ncbi:uncharacterized protein LOC144544853 [Carex rostrata]
MKHVFIWKIDGFKSLLEQGKGSTNTSFEMLGICWCLAVYPMDRMSGATDSEKHMSLQLRARRLHPSYMLETKVKFFIHDQRHGKHIEREVSHTYLTTSERSKVPCMIPLKTLKNPSLGFLLNDSIAVGVELIEIKKVPCNGVERVCFIQKNKSSGSYSWYIEDFSQLSRPFALSKPFMIGGYTWRIRLDPEGKYSNKNYISLYLELEHKSVSQLPPSSGVMVETVLSIKRQSQGVLGNDPHGTQTVDPFQEKLIVVRCNFTPSFTSWGISEFLRLEDFKAPSNGYLIKGTCTIEASVCVLGSEKDRSS